MAFDHDLDRPLFINPTHQFSRQGLDNPDAIYFNAYLQEGVEYVVRGVRGTTADLSFQVMGGAYTADSAATSMLAFDDRELDIADDGSFEFTYVAEPGAKTMIVREVYNDWDTEERGTSGSSAPDTVGVLAKPLTEQRLRRRYEVAGRLLTGSIQTWLAFPTSSSTRSRSTGPPHRSRPRAGCPRSDPRSGTTSSPRDEALVVTVPEVHRLRLPGDPDRFGLVRLDRLRDPPDLADQGPGGHRPRRHDAVRDLRAPAGRDADRELAGDDRPPDRRADAALAAHRARPRPGGRAGRREGPAGRRTGPPPALHPLTTEGTPRGSPPGSAPLPEGCSVDRARPRPGPRHLDRGATRRRPAAEGEGRRHLRIGPASGRHSPRRPPGWVPTW